jgi:hypothetical protein
MKCRAPVLCSIAVLVSLAWTPGLAARLAAQAATPAQPGAASQAAASTPAAALCPKTWVGHEAEVEEFLRTAPIAKITELPIGVTRPKRAYFAPGGLVASAAWKPLSPGMKQGYMESYKSEIAAYEMDKLLGLHMVPPYVERRVEGDLGALAFWVENVHAWKIDSPVRGPDALAWDRQVVDMKMFDQLIGNGDRNQGNLLYDDEYHLILIDHSRALTNDKSLGKMAKLTRVDRELWQKMLALDEAQIEAALGAWCDKGKRKAILQRRDEMKKNIDKLVAEKGEAAIFLPSRPGT